MNIDKNKITNMFFDFEKAGITYALLRDVDKILPELYSSDKDIDIIIRPESRKQFIQYLHSNKWKRVEHPLGEVSTIFLYAMTPFEFYLKEGLRLDICYQLSCKSTNAGEWMPIDRSINQMMWTRIKRNNNFGWYELSTEDELIHLLTRCIFDKKNFNIAYQNRIEELLEKVNIETIKIELNKVFFKFTDNLLDLLIKKKYNCIIKDYLTFKEY